MSRNVVLMIYLSLMASVALCSPSGIRFQSEENVNTRLGLIGLDLGLSPTGDIDDEVSSVPSAPLTDGRNEPETNEPSGRVPGGSIEGGSQIGGQDGSHVGGQCCCVPSNQRCADPFKDEDNFVDDGLINVRDHQRNKRQIVPRIVNRPAVNPTSEQTSCPSCMKSCCYDYEVDLTSLARNGGCINPQTANQQAWVQGCDEVVSGGGKTCGTRPGFQEISGLTHGQAAPGEFPWTCLLLNQNNDFIGTCAIIPEDFSNNNGRGTRRVLTAAHKLKVLKERDLLKVRVGEYDASGSTNSESAGHLEYTVVRILKHPQMSNTRLSNDLAILYVDEDIDLSHPYVNTACLPSCQDQFDYQFSNGTGVRCWVAGWGKDEEDGSFQFIPRKVDLPLVDDR